MTLPARYFSAETESPTLVLMSTTSSIVSGELQLVPTTHPSGQVGEQERAQAALAGYQVILGSLTDYVHLPANHTHHRLPDEPND
jgi:hypothetical protein